MRGGGRPRGKRAPRPAVFLDRDGTVIRAVGYLKHLKYLGLYARSAEAVRLLNERGLVVALVTNQSGVARGYYTLEFLDRAHRKLSRLLARGGARMDGIYLCPHHPDDRCGCRKPRTGLLVRARRDLKVDLGTSFVVGDKRSDVELARRAGARSVLVLTGDGRKARRDLRSRGPRPDFVARDLYSAALRILESLDGPPGGAGAR